MDISPIDYLAAFFSAGVVLAVVRLSNERRLPQRYSMSTLLIAMTAACAVLGLIGVAIQK